MLSKAAESRLHIWQCCQLTFQKVESASLVETPPSPEDRFDGYEDCLASWERVWNAKASLVVAAVGLTGRFSFD